MWLVLRADGKAAASRLTDRSTLRVEDTAQPKLSCVSAKFFTEDWAENDPVEESATQPREVWDHWKKN